MIRGLRLGLAVATALVSVPLGGVGAGAVAAAGSSTGGACKTDAGVTVVVDMSAFDGSLVVRCVAGPLPSNYTGWDALADAGFDPQAPSREPGFVCRVSGEPSASRSMDIPENPDYHEQCVNTPPLSAYWGYWYATNGGSWTYSSTGAGGRRVIEGGYEGWAFSLNSGGHPPKPGIAPSHPVSTPGPTHPPRTSAAGADERTDVVGSTYIVSESTDDDADGLPDDRAR